MNHAFFKALLFLSAGSIIHSMADNQDQVLCNLKNIKSSNTIKLWVTPKA